MSCAKGGVFGGDYFKRRFDAVIFLVMTAEWYMQICDEVHPRKKTTGISQPVHPLCHRHVGKTFHHLLCNCLIYHLLHLDINDSTQHSRFPSRLSKGISLLQKEMALQVLTCCLDPIVIICFNRVLNCFEDEMPVIVKHSPVTAQKTAVVKRLLNKSDLLDPLIL